MKKTKIILFHHSDSWGGGSLSLLTIADSLNKKYNVVVYLPHTGTELFNSFHKRKICVRAVGDNIGTINTYSGGPPMCSKDFILYMLKIILFSKKKITEIIDKETPDIVIANSMTLCWIGKICSKSHIRSVCFVRETATKLKGMSIIYYFLNHYFDGVAYLSEFDKKQFNGKASVQRVIPDTILPDHFQKNISSDNAKKMLNLAEEYFYILYVGGTVPYPKGWNIIKNAMAMLKKYNIKLILTGNITENIFDSYNIINLGTVKKMDILYSAADIVVFPSTAPHQARPAYEAGYAKKPIIITDYIQTREYVIDNYNGLTFPEGNAYLLAKAILKLYKNKDLRTELGENNYKESIKKHSLTECEKTLFSFIEEVIRR